MQSCIGVIQSAHLHGPTCTMVLFNQFIGVIHPAHWCNSVCELVWYNLHYGLIQPVIGVISMQIGMVQPTL